MLDELLIKAREEEMRQKAAEKSGKPASWNSIIN
jgi:hypothetical protein